MLVLLFLIFPNTPAVGNMIFQSDAGFPCKTASSLGLEALDQVSAHAITGRDLRLRNPDWQKTRRH